MEAEAYAVAVLRPTSLLLVGLAPKDTGDFLQEVFEIGYLIFLALCHDPIRSPHPCPKCRSGCSQSGRHRTRNT